MSHVVLQGRYQPNITATLLGLFLLQACQPDLSVLQEEKASERPTDVASEQLTVCKSTLATPHTPGLSLSQPSSQASSSCIALPNRASLVAPSSLALNASDGSTMAIAANARYMSRATLLPTVGSITSCAKQVTDTFNCFSSKIFTASSGEYIRFGQVNGQWRAQLHAALNAYVPQRTLRVVSPTAIGPQLAWLQNQDVWTSKIRIHVLPAPVLPYQDCVYLGKLGLLGGADSEEEDTKPPARKKQKTALKADASLAASETYVPKMSRCDVFISHVGEDKESVAIPMHKELTLLNINPFVDKAEQRVGNYAPENMVQAMKTARCGVFILSPEFVAKEWPMKELRCFLRRHKEAKDKSITPPLLVPIFHRLPWEDCKMTPQAFFKKYEGYFTAKKNGFMQRVEAKETTIEQVMEDLQILQQLKPSTESKHKKQECGYPLIITTAQEIREEMKRLGLIGLEPPEAPTYHLCDRIDFPVIDHYILRDLEIQATRTGIYKAGICILHGYEGTGKSTLAVQYAKDYREHQSVIRFVPMTSKYALVGEFQRMAQELGVDWESIATFYRNSPSTYRRALGRLVYRSLDEKDRHIFLILDNAQEQHVETFRDIIWHRDQDRVEMIITTRDQKLLSGQYPQVALADFSEQESRAYVSRQLQGMDRKVRNYDVESLLEAVGRTPIKLMLAMRYLAVYKTHTPSKYIKQLRELRPDAGVLPQVEMGLEKLPLLSQQIMRYSTLLDATSIPLTLLGGLIKQDREQLETRLDPLLRFSLVNFLPDRQSIQVHQTVQISCYTYRKWSTGGSDYEATLLSHLVDVLHELMPWAASNPDACRQEAHNSYVPHVLQVLSKPLAVLGDRPAVASLLELMGYYQRKVVYDHRQAYAYLRQALEMYSNIYENVLHPDVVRALSNVGFIRQILGEAKRGLGCQEQALRMCQALYGEQPHPELANSLNNVGLAYSVLKDASQGLTYRKKVLEMRQVLYSKKLHPVLADSFCNVGLSYNASGKAQEALTYFEQALEIYQAFYGEEPHFDIARSLGGMGMAYRSLQKAEKELACFEQVSAMYKTLYSEGTYTNIAHSLYNVGIAYTALGEAKKGIACQEQALRINQALYGEKPHPDMARSLHNVAVAYQKLGEVAKEITYERKALKMRQELYKEKPHYDITHSLRSLGHAYLSLGRLQKAIHYYEEALKSLPKRRINIERIICHNLGRMYYVEAVNTDNAELRQAYFDKARKALQRIITTKDTHQADKLAEYANLFIALGQLQKAHTYLIRAIASSDNGNELYYSSVVRPAAPQVLREHITHDKGVEVRAVDCAYYLLIHHYEDFVQAGIKLKKTRESYLDTYKEDVKSRSGQPGKEKQDEFAQLLLKSLST